MAEINNSLAAQIHSEPVDLTKTLQTMSSIDLARAHAGLYGLQAQQEARKLQGFDYLKGNPKDYLGAIQRGLDPAVGSTLQGMSEKERQYQTNPQGLGTESMSQLTAAGKNIAETGKLGAETQKIGVETSKEKMDVGARVAQMIYSDPSDAGVNRAHDYAVANGVKTSPLVFNQMLGMPPDQRRAAAQQRISGGMSPADATAPHTMEPTARNVTRLDPNGAPQQVAPQPGQVPGAPGMPPVMPQTRINQGFAAPPLMTPGQVKQQTGLSEEATKEYGESAKSYEAAQGLQQRLAIINHNIAALGPSWMGAGADVKANAGKIWNGMLDTAGVTGAHIDPAKIATWEDFNKETVRAGMELIKSNFGGSREAASIIQMGNTAVPSVRNTQLGAQYVSATIGAAAQRQIDLHEYKASLARRGDSLVGADVAFNKMHPAEDYAKGAIVGVIPPAAIDHLTKQPNLSKQFDQQFGPGMAQYILSHRAQ